MQNHLAKLLVGLINNIQQFVTDFNSTYIFLYLYMQV